MNGCLCSGNKIAEARCRQLGAPYSVLECPLLMCVGPCNPVGRLLTRPANQHGGEDGTKPKYAMLRCTTSETAMARQSIEDCTGGGQV
jgi:hypothetical protein